MKNYNRLILRQDRSGLAIVLVLGVIAITMAMSYALMRSQFTTVQMEANSTRQGDARQAAVVGITRAIRVMHDASAWGGVDSTIEGNLSSTLRYEVTYTAGDPSLDPANRVAYPNREYDKYPYRVTLDAIGYAVDPDDNSRETSHRIRTVMQLVPRKLATSPPIKWSAINQYTVYQWDAEKPVEIGLPLRVEGPGYLQGAVQLSETYPYDSKPFDGAIDEVAIFNYALSAAQLQTIYTLATASSSVGIDALGTAYASRSPSYWWRMNEATGAKTIADSVGGKHGTFEGVHRRVSGSPGTIVGAADFRGRHDAVNLGNLEITSSTMTICAWFKADSFARQTESRIISKATSTEVNDHCWMLSTVQSSGAMRLRFRLKTLGSTTTLIGTGSSFSTGQWVFASAVYDGLFMRLYQNGVQVGSALKVGSIATNSLADAFIGDNPPGSSRAKYLVDLERMRVANLGDHRPFTGPLSLGVNRTDELTRSLLTDQLTTSVNATIANNTSAPLTHPGSVTTYRLYTGGPVYSVPRLAATISGQTIEPEPVGNPLGVFRDSGQDTSIYANTKFKGVLIFDHSGNDIQVKGSNVTFSPVQLPALDNGMVYELPVVLAEGDFLYETSGSGGSIRGMVVAWDTVCLEVGQNQTLDFVGRIVARELHLRGPAQWAAISESTWGTLAYYFRIWNTNFNSQIAATYFPEWLREAAGYDYTKRITVKADSTSPNYHWHDWQNPIIVPHPNDPGLRWDLVEWIDNPLTDE